MKWLDPIGSDGGSLADQAAAAYAQLPSDTLHVTEYVAVSQVASWAEMAAARPMLTESAPVVTTVVVAGFPGHADRLLLLEPTVGADSEGVVWLPDISGVAGSGEVGRDLGAQTATAFATAKARLAESGLGLDAAVMTVDHSTPATRGEYRRTGRVRKDSLGPVFPGAAGILQDALRESDALISVDVVASRHPLRSVNPGWDRYERLTYSPAVEAGPLLFMSGQGALDPTTELALFSGDVVAQADYTYRNIVTVLQAAGLGPEALVRLVEYVTPDGLARLAETDEVRDRILGGHRPPLTQVSCAGLLRPEFEIEVIPLARRA